MFSYLLPSNFASLLMLIIIFLADLPLYFCADYFRYSNCSRAFECGKIKDITYPFWGNGRAEYCGYPDFELKCQGNSTKIQIQSQSSNVLDFNEGNQTLRIARMDGWKNNCPSQFTNISLPSNRFNYSVPSTVNLTLFYGCPLVSSLVTTNRFTCSTNNSESENYFWIDHVNVNPPQDLSRCMVSVVVPVLQTLVHKFTSSQSSLEIISRSGFEVGYLMNVSACDECAGSGGYNSNRVRTFACLCSNGGYAGRCPISASVQGSYMSLKTIAGLIFGIGVGGVFVAVMFLCYWKRRHSTTNCVIFWKRESKAQRVVNEFLKNYGSMAPKRYKYSDIKKITSSFKDKIGQGGYGGVFNGQLPDGRLVAVKLLNEAKGNGEDFINELASIIRTSHVNIVSLLGFCFDGPKRAVIYEFMANGSLEKFIYGSNSLEANSHLGCQTLYRIVVGVARGLEYLHRGCSTRILHFDIKPHNILLDQDFVPKISDFGLAKLCPGKESIILMLDARGTAGYIAPEVFNRNFGAVSHKSDVYSYGMMVLEIIGRRKNIDVGVDNASEVYFPDWIYKRLKQDEDLQLDGVISQQEEEITKKMILVGLWCIQTNPANRPGMSRVVEMLEGNHVVLSIPPEPYLCFPAREQVASSNT